MKIHLVKPELKHVTEISNVLNDFLKNSNEMISGIQGASDIHTFENIDQWIKFAQKGTGKEGWMPFKQYLAINEENEIVGFINLRLQLNDHLLNFGGHIGYSVCPSQRKKGYATEMLKQTLKIAKKEGISKILITCLDTNIASEKVILNNDGVYEDSRKNGNDIIKRFWII
ncbi:GNAT family N-acetyltransferase [Mesoplasma coleopterae]|uniref:GNAT family N-acetyltransferase n=1 Tax=Mesoplasma coleopterae TaxID=324078 RepID=UPI000D046182|nr:GNAT family N-acetyltransferase [Mesoplasma coleopterae]AVN62648.1 GNAT family N-acetyltransferase [Mesoplasma coleopterae]